MKGLLLYNREDYIRNIQYIKWFMEEAKENGLSLDIRLKENFIKEGVEETDHYDFLINRTRSYEISLMFELNHIRVFNNSQVTLLGNNKLAAYKYADDKGYSYPKVLVAWKNGRDVLSKPNQGHGGEGIGLLEEIELDDGWTRLQQEFIKDLKGDIRFYIINNKIVHAVLRSSSKKLVSNFSQGGDIAVYNFSDEERIYVEEFIKDLKIDYAGIDFLLTREDQLIFNEIEDMVGSRMLSKLGINNTTELYLKHIRQVLKS